MNASYGVQRFDLVNYVILAMPGNDAAACCLDILEPVNFRPIGEFNDETTIDWLHNDRCFVAFATAPSDMLNNCKGAERTPRNPASQRVKIALQKVQELRADLLLKGHEIPLIIYLRLDGYRLRSF